MFVKSSTEMSDKASSCCAHQQSQKKFTIGKILWAGTLCISEYWQYSKQAPSKCLYAIIDIMDLKAPLTVHHLLFLVCVCVTVCG